MWLHSEVKVLGLKITLLLEKFNQIRIRLTNVNKNT